MKIIKRKNKHETLSNYAGLLWNFKKRLHDQWLSQHDLKALQNAKIQQLICHTYENVPYYRNIFQREGITPKDILTVDDLPKIPVSTKADIRELTSEQIISHHANLNNCHTQTTSGSSGIPLKIYWDNHAINTFYSTSARAHQMLSTSILDTILSIGPTYYPSGTMIQKLGICRIEIFSPFNSLSAQVEKINDYKPDILLCYPSVLKSLHHYIQTNGYSVHQPRMVIISGEFLDDKTSMDAKDIFGSRPFQFYGAWEMGRIGNTCRHNNGLHLNEDVIIPEFIPADQQYGEKAYWLVLTNLHNYTMPFIRYQVGDIVRLIDEPCDCNRNFRRINMLDARGSDIVHLPDGNKVSSLYLNAIISKFSTVSQFKFIQKSRDRLCVLLVDSREISKDLMSEAIAEIDDVLPGITTEIQQVEYIAPGPNGKFICFESALNQQTAPDT
ncbi:MAG: phenylacetate--CoA ligase family protein [Desulfobacteraceae bacterium]|nr:phenylacetate--CoA ligase family protein [Desulfobacteraceae bacterium]MBC2757249.1 phenylacetate--CoA ligase family protein [Desulfobacteraceae bacterium]